MTMWEWMVQGGSPPIDGWRHVTCAAAGRDAFETFVPDLAPGLNLQGLRNTWQPKLRHHTPLRSIIQGNYYLEAKTTDSDVQCHC